MDFKSPPIYALLRESGTEEHHTSCIASMAGCEPFVPRDREPLMSKFVQWKPSPAALQGTDMPISNAWLSLTTSCPRERKRAQLSAMQSKSNTAIGFRKEMNSWVQCLYIRILACVTHGATARWGVSIHSRSRPQQSNVVKHSRSTATQDKSARVIPGLSATPLHSRTQKHGFFV